MKFFYVALCVLVSLQMVYSHTASEEAKDVKECAEEHHTKVDDMKGFFDGKDATKDLKCFMKCVLMRLEVLKEDGTIDMTPMKDPDHDEIMPAVEECAKIDKSDDLCEMAYQHSLCVRDKTPAAAKWKTEVLEQLEGQ